MKHKRYTLPTSYYKSSSVCLSVCLSVCSPTPPRSFDGSSPNWVGVCRWTSELPLRASFFKRSTGQWVKRHFFGADDTRLRPHRCKRLTASFTEHGVFCPESKSLGRVYFLVPTILHSMVSFYIHNTLWFHLYYFVFPLLCNENMIS